MIERFRSLSMLVGMALVGLTGCGAPAASPEAQGAPATATAMAPLQAATPEELVWLPTMGPTPLRFAFPASGLNPVSAWRPPPYPVPWAIRLGDHFYFARPIPSGDVNWAHPLYRYGNTYFGEESIHTGVDLGAERNTPVLAAGPGEVVWVGFGLYRGVPAPDDPYGLAVAIEHDFGHEGQRLYSVYGHLGDAIVWLGQRVETGETIGHVGSTGHASGPHLHFEVRLGENRYYSTRNPELWMVPPEGWGVLAGRVLDRVGNPIPEQLVQIYSVDSGRQWEVWTYALETAKPDSIYRENFAISDLPAGAYEVRIIPQGRSYTTTLFVYPGQTNFFIFRTGRGFTVEPTPTAISPDEPPDLP
jgi:murein DD-endopeptidase MepM/ murein hydrolase activator NlpD